jgi:Domain of unknown function (DUF4136)
MNLRTRIASIVIVIISATLALAQDVQTDYDHHVDFSQYKTYSWAKVETSNSIWDSRVKDAVDKELQSKGLTQAPSDGDIAIVAVGTTREKPTLETYYSGGFGGWGWRGFGDTATTTVENYKEGTLVVDMFDNNTRKLIWRGTSSDTLSDKSEKNIKKLDKGVDKMFKDFPPKAKT